MLFRLLSCSSGSIVFVSVVSFPCCFGVSMVSAVPAVSVISLRWFRFGVSGFSTCPFREIDLCGLLDRFRRTVDRVLRYYSERYVEDAFAVRIAVVFTYCK